MQTRLTHHIPGMATPPQRPEPDQTHWAAAEAQEFVPQTYEPIPTVRPKCRLSLSGLLVTAPAFLSPLVDHRSDIGGHVADVQASSEDATRPRGGSTLRKAPNVFRILSWSPVHVKGFRDQDCL